jgi:hypothetical protein
MKSRLYVVGVLGGVALLIVALVVAFSFGRHDAAPPSLKDRPQPDIPGEILYLDKDSCFRRATASDGQVAKLACIPQEYSAGLYWLDEDTAELVRYGSRGPELWDVDLRSGTLKDTGRILANTNLKPPVSGGAYAPNGAYAFGDSKGGVSVLVDGRQTQIAQFDVGEHNGPQVLLWSPDSNWLLLQYYPRYSGASELWIVSRDGQTQGTLAHDASQLAAWRINGLGAQPQLP